MWWVAGISFGLGIPVGWCLRHAYGVHEMLTIHKHRTRAAYGTRP